MDSGRTECGEERHLMSDDVKTRVNLKCTRDEWDTLKKDWLLQTTVIPNNFCPKKVCQYASGSWGQAQRPAVTLAPHHSTEWAPWPKQTLVSCQQAPPYWPSQPREVSTFIVWWTSSMMNDWQIQYKAPQVQIHLNPVQTVSLQHLL